MDVGRFDVSSKNQSQIIQIIQGMQDIELAGAETSKRWEWERNQLKLFRWNIKSLSLAHYQGIGGLLINQSKKYLDYLPCRKSGGRGATEPWRHDVHSAYTGQFNAPVEQMIGFLQSGQDAQN
ncbi:hypothetical protein MUK70_15960 [Dyadobacter chenwenxiniae]|uniref:Uncharacterized protein n=1 Tax=Dyadobacter chenwenxiniae TaxID=2906456 RepID=A0A9X1PGE9_9BACT|nr:hypothetical protein [Dyadobacter chenwenxiniae]MCF0060737.1 hypothetical protein [Dyadobacter chenwenxiniae]UON80571.1 hypothetical protein MUK70_15960 [Dyadobacter chenwenxiniae]